MAKNLILIHLESLNRLSFEHNINSLPNLKKILSSSLYYENYYSSATSTYMIITDLFYGNSKIFENLANVKEMFSSQVDAKDLFSDLRDNGYSTKIYGIDIMGTGKEYAKVYAPTSEAVMVSDISSSYFEEIKNYIVDKERFALFLLNLESHLEGFDRIQNFSTNNSDIYKKRFVQLDIIIGQIMSLLQDTHKADDTCVVLYGDHGDDFWGHGLHDGYTHAIEPFPFLINCPLIVWNQNQQEKNVSDLVSTTDLYTLIKKWMGLTPQVDIVRDYIFSRNLFAGQPVKQDSLNKSYMVSDGNYTLLVSSKGMKMYCNAIDPLNSRSFLDFFRISSGKLVYNKIFDNMKSTHYHSIFSEKEITEIIERYEKLKVLLVDEINAVYLSKTIDMDLKHIDYDYTFKDKKLIKILEARLPESLVRSGIKSILGASATRVVRKTLRKLGL